jgi:Phosphotransferase enzyme family
VDDQETTLPGSRLNSVVKVGDTVRRSAGPWTPTVHALLRHIRGNGFTYAPEPRSVDDQGREVLSYVPGDTVGDAFPWPGWVWEDALLREVGRATAAYHRAVADFRPAGVIPWQYGPAELRADQIVCHHDIAPYNVVAADGQLQAIIDWDLSGPGTARSDLAFVAWQWVPLQHPAIARMFGWHDVGDLGRRLRMLLDSYGLHERSGFVGDVIARIQFNREVMLQKAAEGVVAYARLVDAGHIQGMDAALEFVGETREVLEAQLA